MSISREDFANRQQSAEEENVLDVIEKVLRKSDAEAIKQTAILADAVHEMRMALKKNGQDQSVEGQKITDELSRIFRESQGKTSQFDLGLMARKVADIEDILNKSDNVTGVELDEMKKLVNLTKARIKEDRGNAATMGALKDAVQYTVDNAIDITALASGLFTDSPLVMFLTKSIGDFTKSFMDKRKAVQDEKQTRLAEQLNEHQKRAHDQREQEIDLQQKENTRQNVKDEKPQPIVVDEGKVVPVEVVSPDIELPDHDINIEHSESDKPPIEPMEPVFSDTSTINAEPGQDSGVNSMIREQQITNELLERFLSFMLIDSTDKIEQEKERDARDDKLFRLFSKKDKDSPLEEKGFFGKLLDNIPGIAMIGPVIAGIGTFITGTLIPAIGTFFTTISAFVVPIMAGIAVFTSLTSAVKNFFNAEGVLGKAAGEYASLSERVGVFIGGIMEGFASIADFVGGLVGFETDLKGWWRDNFTIPLANFLENFSISSLFHDAVDYIKKVPQKIMDGAGKLVKFMWEHSPIYLGYKMAKWVSDKFMEGITSALDFIWEYSPANLFMKGLKKINEVFDIDEKIDSVKSRIAEFFDNFDILDLVLGPFDNIYRLVDEKFNITDKIKSILAPLDIGALIEKMKSSILSFIPDFLLSDDQKESKRIINQQKEDDKERQERIAKESKDFVKHDLADKGIVDYNRFGKSEVKDWDSVEKMDRNDLGKMIAFDDWDKPTEKRINELLNEKQEKDIPDTISTAERQRQTRESLNNSAKMVDQKPPVVNIEIVPPKEQPMIAHRIGQTTNIDSYQKMIEMTEKTKQDMPPMPVVNQTQQINSHASFNVPAIPYNQEQGIRNLQKSFAT